MARFFVGQRVRIKFCLSAKDFGDFTGREARIFGPQIQTRSGRAWQVAIDGAGMVRADGWPHLFGDDQLEPILPEGHKPSELTVEELLPFLFNEPATVGGQPA